MEKNRRRRGRGKPGRPFYGKPSAVSDGTTLDHFEVVTLGKPVHGGACLAHTEEGRTLFVRGGLPGERVKVCFSADHKRFSWADVVEVVEPSPNRIAHIWKEAEEAGLGGVELGHVAPSLQRQWKSQVLDEQLRRLGGAEVVEQINSISPSTVGEWLVEVRPAPGDEEDDQLLHRRTRIQLVADQEGALGMRKYRSHEVVPLHTLPIADESILSLGVLDTERWAGHWEPGERVAVEAPNGSDPVLVTSNAVFTAPGQSTDEVSKWIVEAGAHRHEFAVRPGSFWQTHRKAPEVLVAAVLRAAGELRGKNVLELYAGSGLFSRFLADALGEDGSLITMEGNSEAADSAALLLEEGEGAPRPRVQVMTANVDATSVAKAAEQFTDGLDLVLLDPPRAGAGKQVVEAIAKARPRKVVLISCDPASGARDLADFVTQGFRIHDLQAWDLFPHTHHFETVTTLVRGN